MVLEVETIPWRDIPQAGAAKGKPDRGRAPDAGSRAHDDCDTAEVLGVTGDWVYQGQERDTPGTGVWGEAAKFRWSALLGPRVLCLYGWTG